MQDLQSRNIPRVTVRARPSSGTDDREKHGAWIVPDSGHRRVRAVHDDVIRTDPDRDARVVTSVTRLQPRACRDTDRPQHDPWLDRSAPDDHASDRETVTEGAGGKCTKSPARSRRQGQRPPVAGRSDAQSLDAGEHRATLRFRRRRQHAEHSPHVGSASGSCMSQRTLWTRERGRQNETA